LRSEYQARLKARQSAAATHEVVFRRLGNWRLLVAIAGAALAWWNFYLLPVPVIAFIILLVIHDRVDRKWTFERRAITWYQRALDRLDNKWMGFGETGARFQNPSHPYGGDLDVFGQGSLFQLLNNARTSAGEDKLAQWLAGTSPLEEVNLRHSAIDDLRPRLGMREDIALLGDDIRAEVHPEWITRWSEQRPAGITRFMRVAAAVLAVFTTLSALAALFQIWPLFPLLIGILAEMMYFMWVRHRVDQVLAAVESPAKDLHLVAQLLARIEAEPFTAPRLLALKQELDTDQLPASHQIARLRRLVDFHDWQHNLFFRPVAGILLWGPQVAFAIENWRLTSGAHIARWIHAVSEIEALGSLAAYASERPDDPYPELIGAGRRFEGKGIGHPLLQSSVSVPNDVTLGEEMRLLLVSGSNMSGKSTLLRSVGLNVVLAWAGAPVRARSLRVSQLQVGAAMRVQDSVLDGKSRFYAEITRIRQIVDLAFSEKPLLFLLDELLSGTNSHDRRIGAEAIVRSLVERGAIGLVTTHDLALAHIADDLAPQGANVHFEDHIDDGRIAFDYRMRPGVVQKSNAIALMRSVGLDV
jgi:hypothetical protein